MTRTDDEHVLALQRLRDAFDAFGTGPANTRDIAALDHAIAALRSAVCVGWQYRCRTNGRAWTEWDFVVPESFGDERPESVSGLHYEYRQVYTFPSPEESP